MKNPFEIVVLSGKGGTGKTSIAAAFAAMAANAVFTDCDVDAADLHLVLSPDIYRHERFPSGNKAIVDYGKCTGCELCKDLCRFNALEFEENKPIIDEFACEGCGLCAIACQTGAITIEKHANNHIYFARCRFGTMIYGKLGMAEENSGRLVSKIRYYAKATAVDLHAELIITDGPPGIGCPVISSVTGTDLVVVVTEPTLSAWHDLERLIEMIRRFHIRVVVILNKYDLNTEITQTIENDLKSNNINVLGKIPYDESMIYALLEGKTINEHNPDSLAAKELVNIWNKLISIAYESKNF